MKAIKKAIALALGIGFMTLGAMASNASEAHDFRSVAGKPAALEGDITVNLSVDESDL